ncbi:MAG: SRPBCC domain-containing protein [Mesorhizobium sp.]|nr:MAG: SRPBCC domain-containing protein [Mesorhizobium sp.]
MTAKQHSDMAADSIEFECELPDPPEKVWRDLLAAWMMPNDIKPEIGSRFAFAKAGAPIECEILNAEPERLLRYSWRERPAPGNAADPLDSIVTFALGRTASGGTHLRIVHDGFARVATSAVAMVGAGCRLSLNAHSPKQTIAANTPRLFLRAA